MCNTAIIYLYGDSIPDSALTRLRAQLERYAHAELRIAADCGLRLAERLGAAPDILLGDLDSVAKPDSARVEPGRIMRSPARKDQTDAQLAVREALARGCSEIVVAGGLGGRADHAAANIGCLGYIRDNGAHGMILDGQNKVQLFGAGVHVIEPSPGARYVSLIPVSGPLRGLTLEGFAYPLTNAEIGMWDFYTVSNEYAAERPRITLEDGEFLLVECFA